MPFTKKLKIQAPPTRNRFNQLDLLLVVKPPFFPPKADLLFNLPHSLPKHHQIPLHSEAKSQCRLECTYLTERWRISVRDRLMLPAILISSFSNESVYWASWSKPTAQSALLASSSACTVCGHQTQRVSPLTWVECYSLIMSISPSYWNTITCRKLVQLSAQVRWCFLSDWAWF